MLPCTLAELPCLPYLSTATDPSVRKILVAEVLRHCQLSLKTRLIPIPTLRLTTSPLCLRNFVGYVNAHFVRQYSLCCPYTS